MLRVVTQWLTVPKPMTHKGVPLLQDPLQNFQQEKNVPYVQSNSHALRVKCLALAHHHQLKCARTLPQDAGLSVVQFKLALMPLVSERSILTKFKINSDMALGFSSICKASN